MDKVLTKEEILRSNIPTITFDKLIGTHISEVYNVMDEYANQEKRIEAIAFCQDVLNEIEVNGVRLIDYKKVDAEQLYQLFQKSK